MEHFLSYYDHRMGEFAFTLEDVCVLLELPCYGQHDPSSIKLSEEEESVYKFFCGLLKDYRRNSGVVKFSTWISLFHCNYNHKKRETSNPLFPNHEHELVALVAMWLARHALSECPDDGLPFFHPYFHQNCSRKKLPSCSILLGLLIQEVRLVPI